MLPGASTGPIAWLGPPCACVQRLQPETWRTLTRGLSFLRAQERAAHSARSLATVEAYRRYSGGAVLDLWKGKSLEIQNIWAFRVPVAFVDQPESWVT